MGILRCFFLLTCFFLSACVREETAKADTLRVNVHEGYLKHFANPPKTVVSEPSWAEKAAVQILCCLVKEMILRGKIGRKIKHEMEEEEEQQEEERKLREQRDEGLKSFALVFVDPNNPWDRVALRFNPGKTNLPNNDHIRSLCKNPSVQLEFLSKEDPILHHSFLWSPPPNLGSINLHFTSDGFLVVNGEQLTPKPCPP